MAGPRQEGKKESRRRRFRGLKPEDRHLWDVVTRDVVPLRRSRLHTAFEHDTDADPPKDEPPPAPSGPRKTPPAAQPRPGASAPQPGPPRFPELAPGHSADIDRRTLTRLRRGQLPIQGRIDLHGMTQAQAHVALTGFLEAALARGGRCVLVITGKGRGGEEGGILRSRLPQWLNDPAIRPNVVSIVQAAPKDGGSGAFYVYLRRRRS